MAKAPPKVGSDADPIPPPELPPRQPSLATRLSLEELKALTPQMLKEISEGFGLEIRVASNSDKLKDLLKKAGVRGEPISALYDKVYDRSSPGYDRVYDRG